MNPQKAGLVEKALNQVASEGKDTQIDGLDYNVAQILYSMALAENLAACLTEWEQKKIMSPAKFKELHELVDETKGIVSQFQREMQAKGIK